MKLFVILFSLIFPKDNEKQFAHRSIEVRDQKGALVALYAPAHDGIGCTTIALSNPFLTYSGEQFAFCAKPGKYRYTISEN